MFPSLRGLIYPGPPYFFIQVSGATVLTNHDRPAIRAVLWEGVPTLSDSNDKPSPTRKAPGGSAKRGSGKGASTSRRSSLGDVGHALGAAYRDTLKEEIPADILALLGKLD